MVLRALLGLVGLGSGVDDGADDDLLDTAAATRRRTTDPALFEVEGRLFCWATRTDGSWKNIIPRRGDGEIDDLEHLLEHKREKG